MLDQVIAGEYAIALNMFSTHAVISARRRARPSTGVPMQPATGVLSPIAITPCGPASLTLASF